jgi:membrane protein involved in colicin uptake
VSEDEARRAAEEARRRAEEEARRRAEEERLRKISESERDATRSMVCPHGNIVGKCSLCK